MRRRSRARCDARLRCGQVCIPLPIQHMCMFVLRNLAATRYYALSAAGALFKHTESRLNTRFATGSLKIRYAPVEGTLMIDMETARNLELVGNAVHRKSGHSLFGWVVSSDSVRDVWLLMQLVRVLNHTYTSMATRLLRANILAPLTGRVYHSRPSMGTYTRLYS